MQLVGVRTVAVIQARTTSTRYPRKILADLHGKPVIDHVVERTLALGHPTVIAVPKGDRDLIALCNRRGWRWHGGPEDDVLTRCYHAVKPYEPDWVLRVTSDCPLIHIMELVPFWALRQACLRATDPYDREHVTTWLAREYSIDTPQDLERVRLFMANKNSEYAAGKQWAAQGVRKEGFGTKQPSPVGKGKGVAGTQSAWTPSEVPPSDTVTYNDQYSSGETDRGLGKVKRR